VSSCRALLHSSRDAAAFARWPRLQTQCHLTTQHQGGRALVCAEMPCLRPTPPHHFRVHNPPQNNDHNNYQAGAPRADAAPVPPPVSAGELSAGPRRGAAHARLSELGRAELRGCCCDGCHALCSRGGCGERFPFYVPYVPYARSVCSECGGGASAAAALLRASPSTRRPRSASRPRSSRPSRGWAITN
jgi:hypothetical protein